MEDHDDDGGNLQEVRVEVPGGLKGIFKGRRLQDIMFKQATLVIVLLLGFSIGLAYYNQSVAARWQVDNTSMQQAILDGQRQQLVALKNLNTSVRLGICLSFYKNEKDNLDQEFTNSNSVCGTFSRMGFN